MILSRFHCTARKPTLMGRSRLAPRAPRAGRAVPAPMQTAAAPQPRAPARAYDGPSDGRAASGAGNFEPAREHERPKRRRTRQQQNTRADRHRRRLHPHHTEHDEGDADEEPDQEVKDNGSWQDGGHGRISIPLGFTTELRNTRPAGRRLTITRRKIRLPDAHFYGPFGASGGGRDFVLGRSCTTT